MTPVGAILILFGLAVAYQITTRGPAVLAAGIAIIAAMIIRMLSVRAANALVAHASTSRDDPWARSSRVERRALSRSLKLTMSATTLTSLFPRQTVTGYALAGRLGIA